MAWRRLSTPGRHLTTSSDRKVSSLLASAQLNSMSGLELCWETRLLSGRERPIYIILMSSNSDQQHLINALDSGADEFIRKPPVGEELYARLRSAERLLRLQNELIELASIDPLTHVFNRRAFFDRAQLLCRGASPLAAIMLDVDHFKRINDTYGHDVGDQVLGAIGREFQSENAVVGRLGGTEFAILIGGASGEAAVEHAEYLRARVAALSFDVAGEKASVAPPDTHLIDFVRVFVHKAQKRKMHNKNAAALAVVALSQSVPCDTNGPSKISRLAKPQRRHALNADLSQ
jgi:two-component system, cell cycle response regulator